MQHKYYFATTNRTISDIKDNDKSLFGGISVLLGRDFAQTTLVIPGGSKVQQVNASIRKWFHWYKFKMMLRIREVACKSFLRHSHAWYHSFTTPD